MPMSGNTYVAPTWVNNAPPAISASELQAMCDTIQENQGDVTSLQTALQTLTSTVNGKTNSKLISYVGNGTYGESNPCSVSFSFPPSLIMMVASLSVSGNVNNELDSGRPVIPVSTLTTSYSNDTGFYVGNMGSGYGKKSADGKTFYWYATENASAQYNFSGTTYFVLGIS